MRYLVTVSTEKEVGAYLGSVQSPTFLLDSHIQGITDSAHAERIVRQWLKEAGLVLHSISVEIAWDLMSIDDESPEIVAARAALVLCEECREMFDNQAELDKHFHDGPAGSRKHLVRNVKWAQQLVESSKAPWISVDSRHSSERLLADVQADLDQWDGEHS